jgi:aminopeptidase YwaD
VFYGTQRSRPGWDAEEGELEELRAESDETKVEIASYAAMPIVLAEDSESADVRANLVDVGEGTKESDYAGRDVKGKIVLVGAQPGAVQDLAVGKFGAVGIVSCAQNQKTAWWGEDVNLIRWGHLETFSPNKTFGFMVSLKTARELRERLGRGETIRLHAVVKAGQHVSSYEVVTAIIPGADAKLKEEEIAFSCHLDHQRPGANDNASGCVTILEVARTLQKLIEEKRLARPARTLRFIWPPEIEGTLALLNGKPEFARRIKAAVHMDMVGGGSATKAVFHVTRGPMSLPSFVHDVAWAFAEFVNEQSYQFAATGSADYPLIAPEGGKEPLRAESSAYTMGSDHDVYQDSSFSIPAIYLNDWPDRYIHTNFDSAANIDPTKLKRAAFIGAASGYFLARVNGADYPGLMRAIKTNQFFRTGAAMRRASQLQEKEGVKLLSQFSEGEEKLAASINSIVPISLIGGETRPPLARPEMRLQELLRPQPEGGDAALVFKRKTPPKGPLAVFGYDYFAGHAKEAGLPMPKLLSYVGLWGSGEEYAYEALNFANDRHAQGIRDAVSAEYGPVPLEMVLEYLQALEKIGVVERAK